MLQCVVLLLLYLNLCSSQIITRTSTNGTYIHVSNKKSFYAAQTVCNELFGTQLASIHNEQQKEEIFNLMETVYKFNSSDVCVNIWCSGTAWIGLTDEYRENVNIWVDGQPFDYALDEIPSKGPTKDCMFLIVNNFGLTWDQYYCSNNIYFDFICNAHPEWTKPIDFSFLAPMMPYNISTNGLYTSYKWEYDSSVRIKATWIQADGYCQRMHGTHLATIINDEDALEAQNLCVNAFIGNNTGLCFIGLNRIYSWKSKWEWIDGTTNNGYVRWKDSETFGYTVSSIDSSISSTYSWTTTPHAYNVLYESVAFLCNNALNQTSTTSESNIINITLQSTAKSNIIDNNALTQTSTESNIINNTLQSTAKSDIIDTNFQEIHSTFIYKLVWILVGIFVFGITIMIIIIILIFFLYKRYNSMHLNNHIPNGVSQSAEDSNSDTVNIEEIIKSKPNVVGSSISLISIPKLPNSKNNEYRANVPTGNLSDEYEDMYIQNGHKTKSGYVIPIENYTENLEGRI